MDREDLFKISVIVFAMLPFIVVACHAWYQWKKITELRKQHKQRLDEFNRLIQEAINSIKK